MKTLDELKTLEKSATVDLHYCEYIADEQLSLESGEWRRRVVKQEGRYFYHEMHNGVITNCFEMALDWEPFGTMKVFAYTLDDKHVLSLTERNGKRIGKVEVCKLNPDQVADGDACVLDGVTVGYKQNGLVINGRFVKVDNKSKYAYQLLKTKINAIGGAKELYIWLENIAESAIYDSTALFQYMFRALSNQYAA
jgi:hypothetical protein